MTKKKWTIVGIALSFVVGFWFWSNVRDPARRPDSEIRDELIQLTPIGADGDAVYEQVKKRFGGAYVLHAGTDVGWVDKTVSVKIGVYSTWSEFPWSTVVWATWQFDKKGKLKSLSVYRGVDTL